MSKSHVVTKQDLIKAANIVEKFGLAKGAGTSTVSTGKPAWAPEARPSTERHTALAAIQRAVGVRKYNSQKGWYVKEGYTGFSNRKALDLLAMNYAFNNSAILTPVLGIEGLSNSAGVRSPSVARFLRWAADRTNNTGAVDTTGLTIKRA